MKRNTQSNGAAGRKHRTPRAGVFAGLASAALFAAVIPAGSAAGAMRILSAEQVLAECTAKGPGSDLLFTDGTGAQYRFITSIADPEIVNKGDGSFHPVRPDAVTSSLRDLPESYTSQISGTVYLLPYPRSGQLSSSASGNCIAITPGVRAYSAGQVEKIVVHEIGHLVQRALLPESDTQGWERYARMRGIADRTKYSNSAAHAYRPREIFAEDFRVLFGNPAARGDGSVENREIRPPEQVAGLRDFFTSLTGKQLAGDVPVPSMDAARNNRWSVYPNPLRAGGTCTVNAAFGLDGAPASNGAALDARLYDVTGREVMKLAARPDASGSWKLTLPRMTGDGAKISAGAYWLRVLPSGGGAAVTIPVRIVS